MTKKTKTKDDPEPKAPDTFLDGYKHNYATLAKAIKADDFAMIQCLDVVTKQRVAVVCATYTDEQGQINLVPLAKMFDGNPYELTVFPTAGGTYTVRGVSQDVLDTALWHQEDDRKAMRAWVCTCWACTTLRSKVIRPGEMTETEKMEDAIVASGPVPDVTAEPEPVRRSKRTKFREVKAFPSDTLPGDMTK
jgi:hypothetical protein